MRRSLAARSGVPLRGSIMRAVQSAASGTPFARDPSRALWCSASRLPRLLDKSALRLHRSRAAPGRHRWIEDHRGSFQERVELPRLNWPRGQQPSATRLAQTRGSTLRTRVRPCPGRGRRQAGGPSGSRTAGRPTRRLPASRSSAGAMYPMTSRSSSRSNVRTRYGPATRVARRSTSVRSGSGTVSETSSRSRTRAANASPARDISAAASGERAGGRLAST